MYRDKLQNLKQEAARMRRELDNITDRQQRDKTLKTYAKLLHEIVEKKKFKAENPGLVILNR